MYHISSPSSIIIHQSGLPQRVYLKTFPKKPSSPHELEKIMSQVSSTLLSPAIKSTKKKTTILRPLRYYIADITLYSYLPLRSLATPFQHLPKRNYLDDTFASGSCVGQKVQIARCSTKFLLQIMDVPYQYPQGVFVSHHLKHARILPGISSNSFHLILPSHSTRLGVVGEMLRTGS